MSLETFLPDFSLRKPLGTDRCSSQKILKEICPSHQIFLHTGNNAGFSLSLHECASNGCPLVALQTSEIQNSKSKLISFSSWISSLFWSWLPNTQALFFTQLATFTYTYQFSSSKPLLNQPEREPVLLLCRLVTNEDINFPEQSPWFAICLTSSRKTQCHR